MAPDPDRRPRPPSRSSVPVSGAWALLADLAVLAAFVAIGRRSHHEGGDVAGFLRVLWPFAVGLLAGTALAARVGPARIGRRSWIAPTITWLVTVVVGLGLRAGVYGRPLLSAFTIVAAVFLALGMFGWRVVASLVVTRR